MAAGGLLGLLGAAAAYGDTTATVHIDNFTFGPGELRIKAGTSVTWTNRDDIPHTVADATDPKQTHSPPLDTGDSYTRRFDKPGAYRYFCTLHPTMQGVVIVK